MPAATAGSSMALPPAAAYGGVGVGGFGLDQVRQLRSVADVNRLLHEASARERAIDAELEQLLGRRGELEARLVELHGGTQEVRCGWAAVADPLLSPAGCLRCWFLRSTVLRSTAEARMFCAGQAAHRSKAPPCLPAPACPPYLQMLQVMRAEAETLAGSTAGTSALAEKVSRKVRELDTAQSRVQSTLGHIGVVMDRLHAVEGIQAALQREDWEAAAQCVARYLELEDELGGPGAEAAAAALAPPDADGRAAAEQAKARGAGAVAGGGRWRSGNHC